MLIRGVIFRSTIRAGHASLAIVVTSNHPSSENDVADQEEHVVFVVIRFGGSEWNQHKNEDVPNAMSLPATSSSCVEKMTLMRSNVRRICKIGNELEFSGSFEKPVHELKSTTTAHDNSTKLDDVQDGSALSSTKQPGRDFSNLDRFVVDYYLPSSNHLSSYNVRLVQGQKWDSTRLQVLHAKYCPQHKTKQQQKKPRWNQPSQPHSEVNGGNEDCSTKHHKSGLGKRQQGEVVADFLMWVLSTMHNESESSSSQTPVVHETHNEHVISVLSGKQQTIPSLQKQLECFSFMERWVPLDSSFSTATSGQTIHQDSLVATTQAEKKVVANEGLQSVSILDVAGGAGHVSLALTLLGIKSTVVDPRCAVGSLPGRDRKFLKKSKKEPFTTFRAWFGSRPEGIDTFFREGCKDYFTNTSTDGKDDSPIIPVCSMHSEDKLLPNCTAIVALHPDEATGIIVETAVEHRIPFVVVPCCVFSRLFPYRLTKEGEVVSTYFDLIDWLVAKDPAIHVTQLPFDGANLAVWATFV